MISVHRPEFRIHPSRSIQGCGKEAYTRFKKPIQTIKSVKTQAIYEENPECLQKGKQSKEEICEIFCELLKSIMKHNAVSSPIASIFDIKGKVSIEIEAFVSRIFNFMNCSESCFISAIILLDRIQTLNAELTLSSSNIHKMIMSAILIATKYCDDDVYNNTYYAKIAGLSVGELNELQKQFLLKLNFQAYIDSELYEQYSSKLQTFLLKKKKRRTLQKY